MLVSLSRIGERAQGPETGIAAPLLDPRRSGIVLGAPCASGEPAAPIVPAAHTLFGPRSACLAGAGGPLIVCDTGHHRLLLWTHAPVFDNTPADLVIGQPDFATEGRNANRAVGPATLNVPTGVASDGKILAVADAWNHRVLLWHGLPRSSNRPADVVLGQADFGSGSANRGRAEPAAETLNWCYGVAIIDGQLFVADTGNRRVLVWDRIPLTNGTPADLVLGQPDFTTRDESAGSSPGSGMRWPHAIAGAAGMLFLADAGSSRIMVWNRLPRRNGAPCDFVLGQADLAGADHNRSAYEPTAATLNMPYGLAAADDLLVVADTANSRLLGFDLRDLAMGAPATRLAGQNGFTAKGDNLWLTATRNSLCWPYGVAVCGSSLAIADSGNNRVLLWEVA